jgi:hypothetical protein
MERFCFVINVNRATRLNNGKYDDELSMPNWFALHYTGHKLKITKYGLKRPKY